MSTRDWRQSEELHLAPQLAGLPEEKRLLRFQQARRDAFMRRPGLGTLLVFVPVLCGLPGLAVGIWLAVLWPAYAWLLTYLPLGVGVWLGTRLSDRLRARLIATELEREDSHPG